MSQRNLFSAILLASLLTATAAEAFPKEAPAKSPICSDSADVYTQVTLVPYAHVEGKQNMDWSKIVVGQKLTVLTMDRDGGRNKLVGDACLIGGPGKPAKFTVTGVDKDGVHVEVTATDLYGRYHPAAKLQLMYLAAYPTLPDFKGKKPKGPYDVDYTVTGKLVLPAGAAPDEYQGTMTLTVQYL